MAKLKVGIATDNWKVKFFKKELTKKGYEYTTGDGVTEDTRMFYIQVDEDALHKAQDDIADINRRVRNEKLN
jgi:hypothetical protein